MILSLKMCFNLKYLMTQLFLLTSSKPNLINVAVAAPFQQTLQPQTDQMTQEIAGNRCSLTS